MSAWIPLLVAAPLAAAALLTGIHRFVPQGVCDAVAGTTAAVTAIGCAALARAARDGPVTAWIGGWTPRDGGAIGIAFVADPLGAGFAAMIALLVLAVLVFARLWFVRLEGLFQALMMIFLGAAVGYALTGDIFNLYVFFELAGVTAFVLTAFRMAEGALHGAMTFALVNSLASIILLLGIGTLYAAGGSVSLHELGRTLPEAPEGAVRLGFVLVIVGFLIKSAAVPFHFWLTDAYAGAAAPVCVLFGGASVTLGVFGAARVFWTAFGLEALPPGTLGALFWPLGLLTALYAAAMALVEPSLKRVLALTTVSHVGVLMIALGAESAQGVAGGAAYLVGHAFAKAALFLAAGMALLGAGRLATALLVLGGLMLADLPGTAISAGKAMIGGEVEGWPGLSAAIIAAAVMSGAAVIFAALRQHADRRGDAPHPGMAVLALGLGALAFAAAAPVFLAEIARGAAHFTRAADVAASVLDGAAFSPSAPSINTDPSLSLADFAAPAASLAIALALLRLRSMPDFLRMPVDAILRGARRLHALHTGHVGDYIAWAVAGLCWIGIFVGALALFG